MLGKNFVEESQTVSDYDIYIVYNINYVSFILHLYIS